MARTTLVTAVLLLGALLADCAAPKPRPAEPVRPDAGPVDDPDQADDCGELGMDLPEMQRELLCVVLHKAGLPKVFTTRWAHWPWRKDTWVVLAYGGEPKALRNGHRPSGYKTNRLRVFAVDLSGETPRVVAASAREGIPLSPDDVAEFDDLKKYKLDERGGHAVAVRVVRERRYEGGSAHLERLLAFRFEEKRLAPVLRTILSYSTELEAGGGRDSQRGSATVEVADSLTDGHYDWLKWSDGTAVRFVWKNGSYEADGEDPLPESTDAEIFE
ncbi:MAG: hypothetical protein QM765_37070 [Myxococcales bacterium]